MDVKDIIVKRFNELCTERNIRINELANISGVTPSTAYSMMDESRRDVSIRTIKKFWWIRTGNKIRLWNYQNENQQD